MKSGIKLITTIAAGSVAIVGALWAIGKKARQEQMQDEPIHTSTCEKEVAVDEQQPMESENQSEE